MKKNIKDMISGFPASADVKAWAWAYVGGHDEGVRHTLRRFIQEAACDEFIKDAACEEDVERIVDDYAKKHFDAVHVLEELVHDRRKAVLALVVEDAIQRMTRWNAHFVLLILERLKTAEKVDELHAESVDFLKACVDELVRRGSTDRFESLFAIAKAVKNYEDAVRNLEEAGLPSFVITRTEKGRGDER